VIRKYPQQAALAIKRGKIVDLSRPGNKHKHCLEYVTVKAIY